MVFPRPVPSLVLDSCTPRPSPACTGVCPVSLPAPDHRLATPSLLARLQRGTDRGYCSHNFLSPATMNMLDGMRSQLLSGKRGQERAAGSLLCLPLLSAMPSSLRLLCLHPHQRLGLAPCCAAGVLSLSCTCPKLAGPAPATRPPGRPAELVSRGFVQSLEAASTNAQRSDLVRAVLVSAAGNGNVSGKCWQMLRCRHLL